MAAHPKRIWYVRRWGHTFTVTAHTRGEAKAKAKRWLDLPKRERLPKEVIVEAGMVVPAPSPVVESEVEDSVKVEVLDG